METSNKKEEQEEHVIPEHEETDEEKYLRKMKKAFLRSFWKNVNNELPPRSGTYWVNICDSIDVCGSMHQDRAYYSLPENRWMSDTMKKENGKVTHWAYPLPPPKDALLY